MESSRFNLNKAGTPRFGLAVMLALALGSCVITGLRAQVVVAPNVMATADGDGLNGGEGSIAVHVMHIIDASQFGAHDGSLDFPRGLRSQHQLHYV